MKFNKFVGTAGLSALSVALLSTSALAESTPLNVPKSVDAYKQAIEDAELPAECLTSYEAWLNRAQCVAKSEAADYDVLQLLHSLHFFQYNKIVTFQMKAQKK